MPRGLMPQPAVQINVVNVVPAHPLPTDVPHLLKVSNYLAHRPFRDTYGRSYLPSRALRMMVDIGKHQPMLGYNSPFRHTLNQKQSLVDNANRYCYNFNEI